jgi:hypothetical protein
VGVGYPSARPLSLSLSLSVSAARRGVSPRSPVCIPASVRAKESHTRRLANMKGEEKKTTVEAGARTPAHSCALRASFAACRARAAPSSPGGGSALSRSLAPSRSRPLSDSSRRFARESRTPKKKRLPAPVAPPPPPPAQLKPPIAAPSPRRLGGGPGPRLGRRLVGRTPGVSGAAGPANGAARAPPPSANRRPRPPARPAPRLPPPRGRGRAPRPSPRRRRSRTRRRPARVFIYYICDWVEGNTHRDSRLRGTLCAPGAESIERSLASSQQVEIAPGGSSSNSSSNSSNGSSSNGSSSNGSSSNSSSSSLTRQSSRADVAASRPGVGQPDRGRQARS